MNILIKDAGLIRVDEQVEFIKHVNIGIRDQLIDFIDFSGDEVPDFHPEKTINGKNKIVMPGLINAHTHCAMTLLRNCAADLPLEDWLFQKIFPLEVKLGPEDIYWGSLLGIAEMLKSGTIAFADMYMYMDEVAEAVSVSGIKANLSKSTLKFNSGELNRTKNELDDCARYFKRWHNSAEGRIKVYVEIHSTYLHTPESITDAVELARELQTGIHMHILETEAERQHSLEKFGYGPVQVGLKAGVFDLPVIAAHCVHLTDEDMAILQQKQVQVVFNPSSNLFLASGIARIPEMVQQGMNVALGTDGAASNNNLNIFKEMNISALLYKGIERNPLLINATQAIKMATVNGAKAIGFENEIGMLKPGMKADMVMLDIDKPHLYPLNDPIAAIVYAAQASDMDTVIINGKILLENRQLKMLDEEMIKYKVNKIASRIMN